MYRSMVNRVCMDRKGSVSAPFLGGLWQSHEFNTACVASAKPYHQMLRSNKSSDRCSVVQLTTPLGIGGSPPLSESNAPTKRD